MNKQTPPPQQQSMPGVTRLMVPRPDHGELSYVGSGRLRGRIALITGGDSEVGRAAAIACAREGADVAINYLPEEEPDAREVVDLIRKSGVSNKDFQFFKDETDFMAKAAKTPRSNCVLDSSKLLASGVVMSHVQDAIAKALKNWKAA